MAMTVEERTGRVMAADDAYVEAMRGPRAEFVRARDAAREAWSADGNQVAYDGAIARAMGVLRAQDALANGARTEATNAIWAEWEASNAEG